MPNRVRVLTIPMRTGRTWSRPGQEQQNVVHRLQLLVTARRSLTGWQRTRCTVARRAPSSSNPAQRITQEPSARPEADHCLSAREWTRSAAGTDELIMGSSVTSRASREAAYRIRTDNLHIARSLGHRSENATATDSTIPGTGAHKPTPILVTECSRAIGQRCKFPAVRELLQCLDLTDETPGTTVRRTRRPADSLHRSSSSGSVLC
jgi:hypothetical protein